jgi:hypothetical protein
MDTRVIFTLSFRRRLAMFVCAFILCFVVGSVLTAGIALVGKGSATALRIATVLQDVVVFISPAIVTAVMITRRPATFLMIDVKPTLGMSILVIGTMLVSIPAMNAIVAWNQNLHLPQSLAGIEAWARATEDAAQASLNTLIGGMGIATCVLNVLIIGVLAGFSEELFFRGTLQHLLVTRPMNVHAAIWISAIVFSAVHFQFFGFVPRMLLGAGFGYVALWSGCLWLPVIAHVLNNSLVVVVTYMQNNGTMALDVNMIGATASPTDVALAIVSAILTIVGLYAIRSKRHNSHQLHNN